jgi:hypothetical protein
LLKSNIGDASEFLSSGATKPCLDRGVKPLLRHLPSGEGIESLQCVGGRAFGVVLKSSKEKRLLVAEGGIKTWRSNSHCLDEVRYGGVVVAFLPKDDCRLR